MEGKLIKTENGYGLKDCELIAFVSSRRPEHKHHKLSLTNCQAIERGYDLDELISAELEKLPYTKHLDDGQYNDGQLVGFELGAYWGFQKALELMGDKKFSEDDLKKIIHWSTLDEDVRLSEKELFQSLQQTEWDVTFDPEELDAEGRLILKRK